MWRKIQWHAEDKTGSARRRRRLEVVLAACLTVCGCFDRALASELVIGRGALQTLMAISLFKDQGRWYLAKGKCYAYLERPHVALESGRVIIDAHLSSQLGLVVGDSCLGAQMMSDVRVSGLLVGSGSHIEIDDIRIDNVQDESTRQVIELLQSAIGRSLPTSGNIDLSPLLKPTVVPGTDIKVSATNLAISKVTTRTDSVDVEFEVKLAARETRDDR